ncbi:M23 family metallopeptidase [Kitasatospora sp. MMS16-BH015]|uniref:M23 family metallopeptidase n=1 Tax=Kitasatospora sp. MMS16-BH015 TaxID=2018025 RepID=UPI00352F7A69
MTAATTLSPATVPSTTAPPTTPRRRSRGMSALRGALAPPGALALPPAPDRRWKVLLLVLLIAVLLGLPQPFARAAWPAPGVGAGVRAGARVGAGTEAGAGARTGAEAGARARAGSEAGAVARGRPEAEPPPTPVPVLGSNDGSTQARTTAGPEVPTGPPSPALADALTLAVALGSRAGGGRAWPVGGPAGVLRKFEAPPARWAAGHRGVDLAAAPGTPVRAAAPGVVSFSAVVAGRPVITVTHPDSGDPPLRTTYLPVTGTLPPGTPVAAGDTIGTLAEDSGHCPTACLHWGLLRGHRYLDPLALLGSGQARLLPLTDSSAAAGGTALSQSAPSPALPWARFGRAAPTRPAPGAPLSGCRTASPAAGGRTWCGSG